MKAIRMHHLWKVVLVITLFSMLAACSGQTTSAPAEPSSAQPSGGQVKLILGAYTTPREAYRELVPIFQKQWKEKTGQDVIFEESYLGSGAQ
jgi:sulfate/thiosulfate transport system substrate-binding protein